jgi:peptidoglycan hydrolase-like protein with peptidoglycan-binding domain
MSVHDCDVRAPSGELREMKPLSARVAFLGFLFLVGAIATNALYFQRTPESETEAARSTTAAARSAGRDSASRPARKTGRLEKRRKAAAEAAQKSARRDYTGALPPDESTPPSASLSTPMPPREVIRGIQRELAHRDYQPERTDGRLDLSTRVAILNYQYDSGVALSGRPSEDLLKQILFGPYFSAGTGNRLVRLENDEALVGQVQGILSRLGFASLAEDGRMDRETRQALRKFARFRDLRADGRLSPRLLLELADLTDERLIGGRKARNGRIKQF